MLVAAVARAELNVSDVEALEGVLALWEDEYPGLSSLPTAAVWADHVKCAQGAPHCSGLKSLDQLRIFNSWHHSNIPLNPLHLDLPDDAETEHKFTGAYWALQKMHEGVTANKKERRSTKLRKGKTDEYGSVLSWNFQLRMFIHIYGDFHQPLHCIKMYSPMHPEGDSGGHAVLVEVPDHPEFQDLHQIWDGCGGLRNTSWPTLTTEAVMQSAHDLRRRFPKSNYKERVYGDLASTDFKAIAAESYELGAREVFKELVNENGSSIQSYPYRPTKKYMETVQRLSMEQVVVGGYRLASVLAEWAPYARQFLARCEAE